MKYRKLTSQSTLIALSVSAALLSGCGKTTAVAAGNVNLQAAPLAGAAAAALSRPAGFSLASIADTVSSGLLAALVGNQSAYAAVSPFTSFKLCNDTLVFTDVNGSTVAVNGSTQAAGLGLLTFTSASTAATALGAPLTIAAGTQIKQIDITSAISTTLCPGFADAVEFTPNATAIHISQNTAFKFKFATPVTISGSSQTLSMLFGAIVTSMVAQSPLNNSTIQTAAVLGVAQ